MIFTEPRFLVFFALVFGVYWTLRGNAPRKLVLLAASYLFYAAWDWRFLSLILISTAVDYTAGLAIAGAADQRVRRRWLLASLVSNLGILGFFKYFNFFLESGSELLRWLGLGVEHRHLAIILPVGISFYTFQTLSYTIDIYRRELEPTRSVLDLALFVAFFPQLVAGPIVRASAFLPQLERARSFATDVPVRMALGLFLAGFVKKACISDNIAPLVDAFFAAPEHYGVAGAWLGVILYAVQIYCDFSGYSDMAIACAALLGYHLGLNFAWPYFAASITDFWRRWHISLSQWLRDYLYIPLGGSRGTAWQTYRNLMLTMLLGGLWHGAAWNFVIWGGLHGIGLAVHRSWRRPAGEGRRWPITLLGTLVTFYFVCVAWIFFRASSLGSALTILRSFVLFDAPGSRSFGSGGWLLLAPLVVVHFVAYRRWTATLAQRLPDWLFAILYGILFAIALAFVPLSAAPFIYFQF